MTYPNSFGIRPTLKHVPTTTSMTVLMRIKTKPVTIEGDRTTIDSGFPVAAASDENPKLSPIRMLKTGSAKHAVYTQKDKNEYTHKHVRDTKVARKASNLPLPYCPIPFGPWSCLPTSLP